MALLKRLVRHTTAITNETWQQIKTAHASGIGLRELARNAGVPEGTVLSRSKREGWMRQIQSAKALAKREDVLDATPVESKPRCRWRNAQSATWSEWRAYQRRPSITSRQWTARKSSTPSIKSKSSTKSRAETSDSRQIFVSR